MIYRFKKYPALFVFAVSALLSSCKINQPEVITWKIDSTEKIGDNTVIISGNPQVISGVEGKAVEFDGLKDGLLINRNPLAGWQEFTIEVEFKPYGGGPENKEQRFFHLQDPGNEDRRILMELRLNDKGEWYGDWYIKTEHGALTLIDSTLTHPVEDWASMSLEYKNGQVNGFVNGNHEVSGKIDYLPVGTKGKSSIGTRMDQRSWFKGAIREINFSSEAKNIK